MKNISLTYKIVLAGLMAALVCVFTSISAPLPRNMGYFNLGDICIFLCAFLMPDMWYCVAAAGIGSGLADFLAGYALYIPATVIIKMLLALCAYLGMHKIKRTPIVALLFIALGVIVVPLGYFIFESIVYKSFAIALTTVPFNALQSLLGAIVGCIVVGMFKWRNYIDQCE